MSDCFVYIIAVDTDSGEGPIKVGISGDVAARIKTLQTACPFKIGLVHSFHFPEKEMALFFEQAFHACQSEHRMSGEWFKMNPIIALQIMCIYVEQSLKMRLPEGYEHMEKVRELSGLNAATQKLANWLAPRGTMQ